MLNTEEINVKIINHNLNHYKNIGFDVKYGDTIKIVPSQLSSGSHVYVDCICEYCSNIKKNKFQDYYKITKELKEPYYCQLCVKERKTKNTLIKKYGCGNVSGSQIIKDKKKKN